MNVFFDTEFTSLHPKQGRPGLISLGCVTQTGQSFYAELTDTWDESLCSLFVVDTVLPLLDAGDVQMGIAELAARLKLWIEGLSDQEVVFRSDSPPHDWPFILEIFKDQAWPKNLRAQCGLIYFKEPRQQHRYVAGLANYWKIHLPRQHHALVDAQSLQFAWKYAVKRGI